MNSIRCLVVFLYATVCKSKQHYQCTKDCLMLKYFENCDLSRVATPRLPPFSSLSVEDTRDFRPFGPCLLRNLRQSPTSGSCLWKTPWQSSSLARVCGGPPDSSPLRSLSADVKRVNFLFSERKRKVSSLENNGGPVYFYVYWYILFYFLFVFW